MSLTAEQRGCTQRVAVGGEALAAMDYVLTARYTATITSSALLTDAAGAGGGFGAVFAADTVRIVLIPRGDLYWNIGAAATANTSLVGQGFALNTPITKAIADTIQVYAAGAGFKVDLLVYTPRG